MNATLLTFGDIPVAEIKANCTELILNDSLDFIAARVFAAFLPSNMSLTRIKIDWAMFADATIALALSHYLGYVVIFFTAFAFASINSQMQVFFFVYSAVMGGQCKPIIDGAICMP